MLLPSFEKGSRMADLVRKDTGADMLCFAADKRELKERLQVRRAERFWKTKRGWWWGGYEVTRSDVGSLPQENLQTVT